MLAQLMASNGTSILTCSFLTGSTFDAVVVVPVEH